MELYQLEAFEAIVANGSFTRAAEALHLTQPAVTRQIANLEAELKAPLFDRLGRTVQLTVAGEALHRYATSIVRLAKEARQAVADVGSGDTGRIEVGASSTLATYLLPPLLRRFRQTHPHVEIAIQTGVSAQILERVRAGETNIGLVTGKIDDPHLREIGLADYETCVVVSPTHPLAHREAVRAAELDGNPLILMETGTNLRTYVDRLLSGTLSRYAEQVSMELDNVEAIKRMIEAELGISMLPEVAVRTEVLAGRLVALKLTDVPRAKRRITLVHRRDKYLSVALKAFMELLSHEITDLHSNDSLSV